LSRSQLSTHLAAVLDVDRVHPMQFPKARFHKMYGGKPTYQKTPRAYLGDGYWLHEASDGLLIAQCQVYVWAEDVTGKGGYRLAGWRDAFVPTEDPDLIVFRYQDRAWRLMRNDEPGYPLAIDGKEDDMSPEQVAGWDRFWAAYPRHVAKAAALKAWTRLSPCASLIETILTALSAQGDSRRMQQARGEWVPEWPYPATWVNGRRWEDETDRRAVPPPPTTYEYDWFSECKRLHGLKCNGSRGHSLQMAIDAEKASRAETAEA
jgi:hypothetical protein